ncbi:hypothetical protein DFQ04_1547 [Algoriphagus boseongensis]|uniref:Histidine kinase/DNA gyrase B/HSP90-like ATPase n=1 Tax=Algoriphagus boseongensis TaxID=1442587 RepID=A0A4R6T4K7_9BACT|nr:hypothetical protein [Algoriphagus boseongensis]TDQ16899.1 hypothetical protein DFQ04_1547 [Algoriphagus boseongensis]
MDKIFSDSYSFSGRLVSGPSAFRKLYALYGYFQGKNATEILLNVDELEWMDANLCAVLDSIIFVLNRDFGHQFFIDKKHVEGKFEIFERNGFIQSSHSAGRMRIDNRDTSIKMTRFKTESDLEFVEYIGESLLGHKAFEEMPEIKVELLDHFLEVFTNIQLHARTNGPIFACGQFYPIQNILKFTLVDIGIGFLQPISDFTKGKIVSINQAILWALEEKHTTKLDAPGGMGLTFLKKYCEENGHGFQIVTDGICWTNEKSFLNFWEVEKFPGTTINLTFNCK